MTRLLKVLCLSLLLLTMGQATAGEAEIQRIGTLNCNTIPHSGVNLLIHSTKGVRCEFSPADGGESEYYRGETGIGFGLDVSVNTRGSIRYAVLVRHDEAGSYQLAGKYEGAGGGISFGLSAGDNTPIQKSDGSISLQPISVENSGAGAAAGFTYLYLESIPK
ncbi:MAG: DUF992 domain-containing protein [Mariprofundaceae bacterium]|nr:DUF992 domain-containing protein [Mariprofundaceae bacterium]